MSTFKDVKVELSTSADFSPETTEVIFKQADVEETIANKGQPQVIQLPAPINARYIRIWGRGHYIKIQTVPGRDIVMAFSLTR